MSKVRRATHAGSWYTGQGDFLSHSLVKSVTSKEEKNVDYPTLLFVEHPILYT